MRDASSELAAISKETKYGCRHKPIVRSVASVNQPEIAWPEVIGDQLEFHWSRLGRPRLGRVS